MKQRIKRLAHKLVLAGLAWACWVPAASGQNTSPQTQPLALTDLTAFQTPGKSWQIVGDVTADLNKANVLKPRGGTGVLVNMPQKKIKGTDLYTTMEHGDLDLELEYMMAKGANSGIYLQGRYELQLLDSWGQTRMTPGQNGGIYERWDDSKPEGQQGFEGYAPRQNASRAPGLWQHLKVSFQAPRFDAAGRKTANAKMLRVEINGVTVHENLELTGPTRGAMANDEQPTGPLRIQGDHGAVAFRDIRVTRFDTPRPELVNLQYTIYKGKFEQEPDYTKLPPEAQGSSGMLTSSVNRLANDFLLRYTGTLRVAEPGEYSFDLSVPGGSGMLKINNQIIKPLTGSSNKVKAALPAGELPFELLYNKTVNSTRPSLGLVLSGAGIREYLISDATSTATDPVDPILIEAPTTTVLRSFMDMPGGPRVVHAVSVGSPEQVHYTYDLDRGALVQMWRGGFLDATPMWHNRGDGSSRPLGAVQRFGRPVMTVASLATPQTAWAPDTTGSNFRPKGYTLDAEDRPVFRYQAYGTTVTDAMQVLDQGQGFRRELTVQNPGGDLYARLAEGRTIEDLGKGLYLVDNKAYYLRLDDTAGAKAVIRETNGRQELIVPVRGKLRYSLLF